MRHRGILILTILPALVLAQQPQADTTGKRQPQSRPLDVPSQQQREAPLPAIDLPEFVITGAVKIDPPDAQKYSYEERGMYVRHSSENTPGTRERETIDLGERFKQSLLLSPRKFSGTLLAGIGNFFTPRIGASAGLVDPSYDLSAAASYWRTKGFTRNADASAGKIGVEASHEIAAGSEDVQQARISGGIVYDARSYKFYGSVLPATRRSISRFNVHLQLSGDLGSESSLSGGAIFHTMSVQDSTTTTTENGVRINLAGSAPIFDFPLEVSAKAWFSTVSAAEARKLSLLTLGVATPRLTWGKFSLKGGVEGHSLKGMGGQEGGYFYPFVLLDMRVTDRHIVFVAYQPSPEFASLEDHVESNPYLSGGSLMRHSIARLAVRGGLESDWSDWLSSRIWLAFRSMTDYPFYADSANSGMWRLSYGGTTSITSFHFDAVANISSNDYFAFKSVSRVFTNTVVRRIPYLPTFEGSATWTHRWSNEFEFSPSLGIVSRRDADTAGSLTVEGHLWTGLKIEYLGLGDLRFFVDVTNLVNQNYELWKGYRAEPFRISAGLTYRW